MARLLARVALGALVLGAFIVLIGLGTWQVQRLAWKEALIAAAQERPDAPAVAPPGPSAWDGFALDEWNYRRVSLTGRFGREEAYAWTVLSSPRGALGGAGYFVVAPFTTEDGWTVLVNRGFVPDAQRLPPDRPGSEAPASVVTIEGLVRRDDPPNFVTPAPDLGTNIVHSRHIETMAAALGVPADEVAPYTIDLVAGETPASGLPQAGESLLAFSNNHLGYAITWYGLAAALLGVVAVALYRRRSA